ncbi:MAG: hypothetical protein CUN55_03880 [Phototrophicales bacterium]|nr:MAG: hypothetical protein CUN55_03880 [Phototrophicales bacterium]
MTELFSNQWHIRHDFMDSRALEIRRKTDEMYSTPHVNFAAWLINKHKYWRGDEVVLDINPTDGVFFDLIDTVIPNGVYVAADVSSTLLRSAFRHPLSESVHFTIYDEVLPFADNSFDIIIANHILFHFDDPDVILSEFSRVLKDDGVLIASTDSQYTMSEFDTLTRRALTLLGKPPRSNDIYYGRIVEPFALESGAVQLSHWFQAVARYELPSSLVFKEPRPVVDFLNSHRPILEPTLPEGIRWEDYIAIMDDQVRRLINHFSELTINRLSGVLLATNRGGFARDYFHRLENGL